MDFVPQVLRHFLELEVQAECGGVGNHTFTPLTWLTISNKTRAIQISHLPDPSNLVAEAIYLIRYLGERLNPLS